jgi:hypothetical protein
MVRITGPGQTGGQVISGAVYRLAPPNDRKGGRSKGTPARDPLPAGGEDLPYKVELWDPAKSGVEQLLAVTASASIGYGAYYAATREFPDRYITLRHKGTVVSRWNAPTG